jgi:2-polyprenyl-3-methyl-5-hydroxy-6-metoxy-1,4-benzoquinol methylase
LSAEWWHLLIDLSNQLFGICKTKSEKNFEENNLVMKYDLEYVDCPFCTSNQYKIVLKNAKELYLGTHEKFDTVRCQECNFVFTNPRPTKESIGYFYPDESGYYIPQFKNSLDQKSKKTKFKELFTNSVLRHVFDYDLKTSIGKMFAYPIGRVFYKSFALQHIPRFVKNGKLLDIGCSWGGYLDKMRNYGWDVYGTEINEKAIQYAHNELNLNQIKHGFFEDLKWEESFFDVVHMNMVLEHLYDPLHSLSLINKTIKANGQLILSVPDISGVESRLYKEYFYGLQVPQHLSHFSPITIDNFLRKSGFVIEKIVHRKFDRDLVASASYFDNKLLFKLLSNRIIRKIAVKFIVNLLSVLGKTSRMTVYARKS